MCARRFVLLITFVLLSAFLPKQTLTGGQFRGKEAANLACNQEQSVRYTAGVDSQSVHLSNLTSLLLTHKSSYISHVPYERLDICH